MNKRSLGGFVAIIALASGASGQQSELAKQLVANRTEAHLENGRLAGKGASVVKSAVESAQFVLVGEDHGIKEIAQFISSVCDFTGPQGFHTLAIETGPTVTELLNQWIARDDRVQQVASFEKQFPNSIAFYNMREENDLLAHCSQTARGGKFQLWGLDQEFLGSTGYLLHLIGETHPGKEIQAALERLVSENEAAEKKANETHNPQDLFMFSPNETELSQFKALLDKSGSPKARALFEALLESRKIYRLNFESGFNSNRDRALLMKHNFVQDFTQAQAAESKPPKILMKFGSYHMQKGFNLIRNNDVGNYVTELADGLGVRSLHIIVLAVKGSQLAFGGIGLPYKPAEFDYSGKDSQFLFFKPAFENLEPSGWTVFDLRPLRPIFYTLGHVDPDMEKVIFGYDLLVMIPVGTPSSQIQ